MKKKNLLCLITAIIFIFTLTITAFADFGDYAGDNDYGGGYDFGGYDSGYDYGNDYDDYAGDDNYGGNIYVNPSYSSGGGSSGGGIPVFVIYAAVIVIVILIVKKSLGSKSAAGKKPVAMGAIPSDYSALKPMGSYKNTDPYFNESEITEKLSNLYVKFQNAWTDKNLEPLQSYLTDAFYAQMDRQLDYYRKNHQTNKVERIAVLGVNLMGWKQEGDRDVIVARLRTRIVDYVVDDNTGNVVRGSNSEEKFMDYEWSIVRSSGMKTEEDQGFTAKVCPNCGAPVSINHSARCEYCDSVLTMDKYNWAVDSIKGIAQQTR